MAGTDDNSVRRVSFLGEEIVATFNIVFTREDITAITQAHGRHRGCLTRCESFAKGETDTPNDSPYDDTDAAMNTKFPSVNQP